MITIPVNQNTKWGSRFWRPSSMIMIELSGLAEDLLCRIKSMSSDGWYDWWFTDEFSEESSELSSEPEKSIGSLASLTKIF